MILLPSFTSILTLILQVYFFKNTQVGFVMQRSTGEVDTSEVYGPGGRYGVGVDYTFKTFRADGHYSVLDDLSVFSRDRLEVFLDVTFQYFIRPDELQPLHDAYDQQYHEIIVSRAESVIKATAPQFNTTDYFINRATIEKVMAEELSADLGGKGCCDSYCSGDLQGEYNIPDLNCSGCFENCPEESQRFHVDVRYKWRVGPRILGQIRHFNWLFEDPECVLVDLDTVET